MAPRSQRERPLLSFPLEVALETVRTLLLSLAPPFDASSSKSLHQAIGEGLYSLLRGYTRQQPDADGWLSFHLLEETALSLSAVGIMHVLPSSLVPMEVALTKTASALRLELWTGARGPQEPALSQSAWWKAMYLYAAEGQEPKWDWSESNVEEVALPRRVE